MRHDVCMYVCTFVCLSAYAGSTADCLSWTMDRYTLPYFRGTLTRSKKETCVYIYWMILPYDRVLVSAIGVFMPDVHGVCMQCLPVL